MNVNEKLPHKDFPKNVWPIHFAELRNYLDFFQQRVPQVSSKNNN